MKMYQAYTDTGDRFLIGEAGLAAHGPDILSPPQPGPEPLTEDELAALEAKWADPPRYHGNDYERLADEASTAVLALSAEVRRLRAEYASLQDRYYDYDPSE